MTITLAVVAYNEEAYLPRLFDDIRAQDYPHERIEVLLIDSASEDGTHALMEEFGADHDFSSVLICDNPARRQAAGWNIAFSSFTSDAIVRVDAHARIPSDFISQCVAALEGDGEPEDIVGGARPTLVDGDGSYQRMLWMAEESMFGAGVSTARRSSSDDETDIKIEKKSDRTYSKSLFHACYRRQVIEKCGGFREDLGRTEDNEYHYRLRKIGYRIYRSPGIYSEQYIRPSLRKMIKQKAGNGYWVGRTLGIAPGCISVYHLVPLAFLLAIITTTIIAVCGQPYLLELLGALYGSVAVLMAVFSAISLQLKGEWVPLAAILLPIVFFLLHISYGAGTFIGLLSIPFGRKSLNP